MITLASFATDTSHAANLSFGRWWTSAATQTIPDPLSGRPLLQVPDTSVDELEEYALGLRLCPKSGRHNAFTNVARMRMLGEVTFRAAAALDQPEIFRFFSDLIKKVMPKSTAQCDAEVRVTQRFLMNFAGDNVRFMLQGFSAAGDHDGQETREYRWPYGPVVIIAPFNFPLEIPALQAMGALYCGNRPLVKVDSKVSIVMEQFVRLLIACGLPESDLDLLHCTGQTMKTFMERNHQHVRLTQFTGSAAVAEWLSELTHGKTRIEDAGFDWKILGPDCDPRWLEYVAYQCDQDAYAASGQKCSAQSFLMVHQSWVNAGLLTRLRELARYRHLGDLTIGPVMTWTTDQLLAHVEKLKAIPGATLLFGGKALRGHAVPECYGAILPTAVLVPADQIPEHFDLVATEVFGPVQVITTYDDATLPRMLELLERMKHHLTAGVVSKDPAFINKVLGATVNGVTYVGMRARTTGAPQNHFFGPAGDPRGAGIGTPEAIRSTWSCPRAIIEDSAPLPAGWIGIQS